MARLRGRREKTDVRELTCGEFGPPEKHCRGQSSWFNSFSGRTPQAESAVSLAAGFGLFGCCSKESIPRFSQQTPNPCLFGPIMYPELTSCNAQDN